MKAAGDEDRVAAWADLLERIVVHDSEGKAPFSGTFLSKRIKGAEGASMG